MTLPLARPLGEIVSDGNSALLVVVLAAGAPWAGRADGRFELFAEMTDAEALLAPIEPGTVLLDLGGCGRLGVLEADDGTLVLASFHPPADRPAGEYPEALLAPPSASAEPAGDLLVTGGAILVLQAPDPAGHPGTVRIARPDGAYPMIFDPGELSGEHGRVSYRLLIRPL